MYGLPWRITIESWEIENMKALVCEMCQSNDLIKQDGYYVCQHCGTKYTVEEAKKLMVEGTVKIDNSDRVQNLYKIARQAVSTENHTDAARYYDQIRQERPDDWEAAFYCVFETAMDSKIAQIASAGISISNNVAPVLKLIRESGFEQNKQDAAITEVVTKCQYAASVLSQAAYNHHFNIDMNIRGQYNDEYQNQIYAACLIDYTVGDQLIAIFGETTTTTALAASCYKSGIDIHGLALRVVAGAKLTEPILCKMREWEAKAKKYDPSYSIPETAQKSGCYVATAVYGSYDCPEVWTLRRFRDNTLAATWYGRAFIHTYYAISPTLVKWFGKSKWFKNLWKPTLDRMVENLNGKGVENTPYNDREW